jgi:hypothetical protein
MADGGLSPRKQGEKFFFGGLEFGIAPPERPVVLFETGNTGPPWRD